MSVSHCIANLDDAEGLMNRVSLEGLNIRSSDDTCQVAPNRVPQAVNTDVLKLFYVVGNFSLDQSFKTGEFCQVSHLK